MTAFRKAVDIRLGFVGSSVCLCGIKLRLLGCTHGPLKLVPDGLREMLWIQAWLGGSFQPGSQTGPSSM